MITDMNKVAALLNIARAHQTKTVASLKQRAQETYPDWTKEELEHHICQLSKELN